MTMDRPTCATCAAFDEAKTRCRRRPPDPRHGWPDVGADSWCLEHITEEDAFPIARQWGMMDRAAAERKEEREIKEAIAFEVNQRLATAGLPPIVPPDFNPFPQAPICVQCGVGRAEYVGGGRYGTKCQSCYELGINSAVHQAHLAGVAELIAKRATESVCNCASCEAYRTPSAQQTTQGPKPETQAAPTPSPEPDPQGL